MITDINPELTRQALQNKYGTPMGFNYKTPVPVLYNFNAAANPEYVILNTTVNPYSVYVGRMILISNYQTTQTAFTISYKTIDVNSTVIAGTHGFQIVAGAATLAYPYKQYEENVFFNTIIISSFTSIRMWIFEGFYFEQP